jgi:micrococcal nuclease
MNKYTHMNSQQKNLVSISAALVIAAVLVLGSGLDIFGWMYDDPVLDEDASVKISTTTVYRVIDGDTINVGSATSSEYVRLIGVDTPEIDWETSDSPQAECYGWEAREFLVDELEGETVRLVGDQLQPTYDKYDRRLAYVYLGDELINQTLIKEGYAQELTVGTGYKFQDDFRSEEKIARRNDVGYWSACTEE